MSTARAFEALARRTGFTGAGVRGAATQGLYLWIANAAVAGLGFLTPLAFARLAAPVDYGRFSLIASMMALTSLVTMPGLNISLTQAAARGFHGALADVLRVRLRWAVFGVAGLLVAGAWLFFRSDPVTGRLVLLTAPLLPLIYGADVAQPFMNGIQRFTALSLWMLVAAAAPSLVVIALLLTGKGSSAACVGYFCALAVVNVAAYVWVASRYRTNRDTDPGIVGYGKRLTLVTSLGTLQAYVDKLAVGAILGLEAVAVYSVGVLFQQALKVTWGALNQLYFPKLAGRDPELARHLTRSTLPYVWASFAALSGCLILAAPLIIHIVFGDAYRSSVAASRILMFGFVTAIPGAQFEILFRSTGDERRLYAQRVTYAIVDLALAIAGAELFGLTGVLWAGALAYTVNSVHGFMLDRRR